MVKIYVRLLWILLHFPQFLYLERKMIKKIDPLEKKKRRKKSLNWYVSVEVNNATHCGKCSERATKKRRYCC